VPSAELAAALAMITMNAFSFLLNGCLGPRYVLVRSFLTKGFETHRVKVSEESASWYHRVQSHPKNK